MFLTFLFFFISLLGSQLIFLLLVFSSSHAHGRIYREIIGANGAKKITTQDNSFSNFLGPKDVVNDAFEELSETERREMDKRKTSASQNEISLSMKHADCLTDEEKKKICEFSAYCRCDPSYKCDTCKCFVWKKIVFLFVRLWCTNSLMLLRRCKAKINDDLVIIKALYACYVWNGLFRPYIHNWDRKVGLSMSES